MLNKLKNRISTNFKALKPYFWVGLGLLVILAMVAFAEKTHQDAKVRNVEVDFKGSYDHEFVKRSDIMYLVREHAQAPIDGQNLKTIQLDSLENGLQNNPYIKEAEVFSGLNGTFHLQIIQRNPLFRVINQKGQSFYIDEAGRKMPVSKQYTARVITAKGQIKEAPTPVDSFPGETVNRLYKVCHFINKHEFLTSLTGNILVNEHKEFTIIPRMGDNTIHLGKATQLDEKFRKLRVFYERVFPREGWYKYKSINLKFDQQIIAKKASYGKQ